MEDLIPLIIGILWLVYTIYSKGKKKEAKRHRTVKSEESKAPSILEQLLGGNEAFKPQPYEMYDEPAEEQLVNEYDEIDDEPEQPPRPFLRKELAEFMQEGEPVTTLWGNYMTEEVEDMRNQVEKTEFDLRKAIIFSEIINAPYIDYK